MVRPLSDAGKIAFDHAAGSPLISLRARTTRMTFMPAQSIESASIGAAMPLEGRKAVIAHFNEKVGRSLLKSPPSKDFVSSMLIW